MSYASTFELFTKPKLRKFGQDKHFATFVHKVVWRSGRQNLPLIIQLHWLTTQYLMTDTVIIAYKLMSESNVRLTFLHHL